jgi:hypothetical protein
MVMTPYSSRTALVGPAFGSYLECWVSSYTSKPQCSCSAILEGGYRPIQDGSVINVKHKEGVS